MKRQGKEHWSKQKEVASSYLPFRLMIALVKILPLSFLRIVAFPVSFFYFIAAKKARLESRRFLDMVSAVTGSRKHNSTYGHIASFALCLVEKAKAWSGDIPERLIHYNDDDIDQLAADLSQKKGAFLLCSHLGNIEMLRALAGFGRTRAQCPFPMTAIVDFSVTEHFNRMLEQINPGSMNHLISANDVGVETVERLLDCLGRGGLVVIAGDRTSARESPERRFVFDFLGRPAAFPMGPFYIAALLKTSIYFCFDLREKTFSPWSKYDVRVYKSGINFDCSRSERGRRMEHLARSYAEKLEAICKEYPYQWYNYYNFWEA